MRNLALLAASLAATAALLMPAIAGADTSTSLTVVGTSDVSDSGLLANVIQPDFHAAYPGITFKYDPTASGTAISQAESGADGASVLLVHAASLENQFVANGYSYNHSYGYAIFRNDFVLAGPSTDPAGVGANAANNIAQAYADIAAAGIAGKATFVSRANTSGTTVSEHAIWALVSSSGLSPSGLLLCTLSAANGGGETPIAAGNGVTASGQACPSSGAIPQGPALPAWYIGTGANQGQNVILANACAGYNTGTKSCYVYSDRGTYDYLASGLDAAGSVAAATFPILTRGPQSTTAPGGVNELINYFHAYIIDPTTVPTAGVNLTAAQDFVNMLTSPAFQSQLATYLDDTADPAGAPFVADASPAISEIGLPTTGSADQSVTVSGSVTNSEPGYPALGAVPVSVDEIEGGLPVVAATGTTSSTGTYTIKFTPKSSGEYQVSTGQISQIENPYFSPVFGDVLSPAATAEVNLTLTGLPTSHSVKFKTVKVKKGKLTVSGTLSPAPALKGTTIDLYALRVTGGAAGEKRIGKTTLGAGKTKFTIKAKLKRGYTYVLQLEYTQKSQTSSYSGLKTLKVK